MSSPHILRDDVSDAVAADKFPIRSVVTIEEAVELCIVMAAGDADPYGRYPAGTVYGQLQAKLQVLERVLCEQENWFGS